MKAALLFLLLASLPFSQGRGQQGDPRPGELPIQIRYVALRPARWEEKALTEIVNEKRNEGGLVFVYYTNTSDRPVALREWYLNDRESGHFRLAGDVAWDRRYTGEVQPGQTTVLEICGVSPDFQVGKKADFVWIGGNWNPVAHHNTVFEAEKLRVTSLVMDESLTRLTLHIRNFRDEDVLIRSVAVEGKNTAHVSLTSDKLEGNGHGIAHLQMAQPFAPGELVLVRLETEAGGKAHTVFSHRNAYGDYFPNGTWGIEENQYADAGRHHLNTMVKSGRTGDPFFAHDYKTTRIKVMPHTGIYPDVDLLRDLANHPAVALWYIHDEPDWLHHPQLIMASHEMTKKYSAGKPTLITLCRNVKFFEFAFIPDIPCHDHYSVTAPTTSKWPFVYGTKLEETGYYTADLKYASEPKPIWVWTQGVHLWDERPKMPLPTPDELGAQLYFNLGRGAKGNLWFTFLDEAGTRFPATKEALRHYSRLIKLLEHDLLASDPYHGTVTAPDKTDVASLITADKLIMFITNTNYQISDSAYQWASARKVNVQVRAPHWFRAGACFEVSPEGGIREVKWKANGNLLEVTLDQLHMGRVVVFTATPDVRGQYETRFKEILSREK